METKTIRRRKEGEKAIWRSERESWELSYEGRVGMGFIYGKEQDSSNN